MINLLEICVESRIYPTRHNIKDLTGISLSTLRRRGFVLSDIQSEYKIRVTEQILCLNCSGICLSKYSTKFCSHSCSATYNNLMKVLKSNDCSNCGRSIKVGKVFCSQDCTNDHKKSMKILNWQLGLVIISTEYLPNFIRKYIFEKYNSKCAVCGWCQVNQTSNKIPLEVEHIDGNSRNNMENNLTLLCPNCHSLTPTFRALNKGKGRKTRR